MRRLSVLVLLLALAGCEAALPVDAGALRALQEAACRAVIAEHVGRPEAEVIPRWLSEADGVAQVETLDGDRRHVCRVDVRGRVLGYVHPDG